MPESACLDATTICSSVKCFFRIPKPLLAGNAKAIHTTRGRGCRDAWTRLILKKEGGYTNDFVNFLK